MFVGILFLLSLMALLRFKSVACGGEERLRKLLFDTVLVFDRFGVVYWLDYGTLLGAVREKGIIGWEYDVDVGMPEEWCEKASTQNVRDAFSGMGYTLYNRSDYIPQKVKLTWDDQSKSLGYSSGYMSTVCLRVYDRELAYFVDVYWFQRVTKEAVKAAPSGTFNLPIGYSADKDLLCNAEGLDKSEFFPGGCREVDTMLPPTSIKMDGVILSVPAKPEKSVEDCYGPNWRVPTAKGINALVCQGVLPMGNSWYT